MSSPVKKILLVCIIVAGLVAVRVSGILDHVTLEELKRDGHALRETVHSHYVIAVLIYVVGYALSVAAAMPGDIVLSIAGGYFFGILLGALYINIGATAGALCSFLFSRYVAGDWLQRRYSRQIDRFNREVKERGYLYFLVVRLIPLFPFVLVNLLSGLTRVSCGTFLWTTSLGIIPVSLLYAYAGSQLGYITSVRDLFTGRILLAFLLLAVLVGTPLLLKKLRSKPGR